MTDAELLFIIDSIEQVAANSEEWKKDYIYDNHTNEFNHIKFSQNLNPEWFAV
jgi:hypothetical protein